MVDDTGMVGYRKIRDFPSGSDSLAAMGAYCFLTASLQLDDWEQVGNRVRAALLKTLPANRSNVDFYRSYFLASALKTAPASGHLSELTALQKSLLDLRVTSGANTVTWNPLGPSTRRHPSRMPISSSITRILAIGSSIGPVFLAI